MRRSEKELIKFLENTTIDEDLYELVDNIKKKFKSELKNYSYITDINDISVGGYIKYIDMNISKIRYGILVRTYTDSFENKKITLKNSSLSYYWNISPAKYFIFYKQHTPQKRSTLQRLLKKHLRHSDNI